MYVAPAAAFECQNGTELGHSFASGASWQFCAVIDDDHALELQELHYQAPGDTSRKVLQHLHLGQVLLHRHDQTEAQSLIGANQLGGDALKTLNDAVCDGELQTLNRPEAKLCSRVRPTGLLAKYSMRPGLQGEQYQLFSVSTYQGFTFTVMVGLSEDGRIAPSVTLSGKPYNADTAAIGSTLLSPLDSTKIGTPTTVLYTWRMVFALNGDQKNDAVDELNFMLEPTLGSRRPMVATTLETESLRKIDRDAFRGWRIRDVDGRGYYLDPQNSGYSYKDPASNWAQFDFALTAFNPCERHTRTDDLYVGSEIAECIGSLDNFVSGDTMTNTKPVIWYSLSRVHRPSAEDYPIIGSMLSEFELIPFDWTPTSPFELIQ